MYQVGAQNLAAGPESHESGRGGHVPASESSTAKRLAPHDTETSNRASDGASGGEDTDENGDEGRGNDQKKRVKLNPEPGVRMCCPFQRRNSKRFDLRLPCTKGFVNISAVKSVLPSLVVLLSLF